MRGAELHCSEDRKYLGLVERQPRASRGRGEAALLRQRRMEGVAQGADVGIEVRTDGGDLLGGGAVEAGQLVENAVDLGVADDQAGEVVRRSAGRAPQHGLCLQQAVREDLPRLGSHSCPAHPFDAA
ncbi:MAG: hypothetical protein O2843_10355 [Chloroflexi bacterium]|nr:hypothetical protein [Chloroflexota bacterium]